jgi:hypothetical protein
LAFIARFQRPFQLSALQDAQLAIHLNGNAGAGLAGQLPGPLSGTE